MSKVITLNKMVATLKPDDVLSENLFYKTGVLFYPSGFKLTEKSIDSIKAVGLSTVEVITEIDESPETKIHYERKKASDWNFIGVEIDDVFNIEEGFLKVDSPHTKLIHAGIVESTRKLIVDTSSNALEFSLEESSLSVENLLGNIKTNPAAMVNLVHLKDVDNYTFMHSVNVSILAMLLARRLRFDEETIKKLGIGCILHDVGKMSVDQDVFNKPSRLTKEEFEEMKKHPKLGYDQLIKNDIDKDIAMIALCHHEKIDGSGYPLGLTGAQIPPSSKIASIVDMYDALTADRVYKKAMHPVKVFDILDEKANRGKLESYYLSEFKKAIGFYPVSSMVSLADGSIGRVIKVDEKTPSRPLVEVLYNRYGTSLKQKKIVNTDSSTDFRIVGIYQG